MVRVARLPVRRGSGKIECDCCFRKLPVGTKYITLTRNPDTRHERVVKVCARHKIWFSDKGNGEYYIRPNDGRESP
jgi:hypothetical protein